MPQGHWKDATSRRSSPRPNGWKRLRAEVLARDQHRCVWTDQGARCPRVATDVDHIGDPADHSPGNLRALCGPHHRARTGQQAGQAAGRATRARIAARNRPADRHPGLL